MDVAFHAKERNALLTRYAVKEGSGLSVEEAEARLRQYGPNALRRKKSAFWAQTLLKQFVNPLIFILILALGGVLYLDEGTEAIVIALAIFVNVTIGFFQEYRASRAFDTLAASERFSALVRRGGRTTLLESTLLVPGDILFLKAGGVVPADAYLLSSSDLSVSEAHLTGESAPVEKHPGTLPLETPIYERRNMAFMGSSILSGAGVALVVATGAGTEIGTIAESLSGNTGAKTPIEKSIGELARFLALVVFGVVVLLVGIGFMRDMPFSDTLLLGIALAVSVVPEGLPAAVTAILAIGMERILKEKGLVRNLLAAETLGSTTVILTDKTGTITEAKMKLRAVVTAYSTHTESTALDGDQRGVLEHALYASDISLLGASGDTERVVYGNAIESALSSYAVEAGIFDVAFAAAGARADFLAFSSARRFAVALFDGGTSGRTLYVNGAPEVLLKYASGYLSRGEHMAMTDDMRRVFEEKISTFAEEGKRVIGVLSVSGAPSRIPRPSDEQLLDGGVFEGLLVFEDPVRADVPAAIREVRQASVRVVMVTGDTPVTARTIAAEAGILEGDEPVVTGKEVEAMDDEALARTLMSHSVFARILPHQKQRLVTVLQDAGEVVAMTGDGINDAPALRAAAIGVAVGSGTEVAREASGLILLGNSFAIITAAIREGRRIMDNLKKAVTHLVATSFHEVFVIGVAVFAGLPLPILPVQILWVNILEEGFLTFAFAFEPAEADVMRRSPRSEALRTVLTREVRTLIIVAGTITGLFSIALYLWLLSRPLPIEEVRTIMFVVLSLDSLLFALSLKSLRRPLWSVQFFNNRYLVFALGLSGLGLAATLAFAPLRSLLSLSVPNAFDFAVLIGVALVNIATIEFAKKLAFSREDAEYKKHVTMAP